MLVYRNSPCGCNLGASRSVADSRVPLTVNSINGVSFVLGRRRPNLAPFLNVSRRGPWGAPGIPKCT